MRHERRFVGEALFMSRIVAAVRRALPANRFARSVSVLAGGAIGGQLIMVLAAPFLTRLYDPQDIGMLAVFVALLSLTSVVACLRYEVLIPIPEDDREAAALTVLSLITLLVFVAIGAVPVLLYREQIAHLMNLPALAGYLYLVPVGAFFAGAYSILNFWAVRAQAFTPLARTRVSQSILMAAIQLGGAPLGPAALLVGQVAGHAAGTFSLGMRMLRAQSVLLRAVRLDDVVAAARKYKKSPLVSTWSALFNTAGAHLPSMLFAALFNPAVAGMLALANRVLALPLQVLGKATASVFFAGAAHAHREGALPELVATVHGRLAHIGMPPTLMLIVAGPHIFSGVFGAEWRQAGAFAQWLAPWLYLVLVTSPLSALFEVLDRQVAGMVYQGAALAIRVASIYAGAWIGDAAVAVALFALGNILCSLVNLTWIIRASGNGWQAIWRPTASALAWAVLLVSPLILTAAWDGGGMDTPGRMLWVAALTTASLLIAVRYRYLLKEAG
jgi:O-antigen/teichoic acid export membrane protein